ncbi:hypothetical protein [Polaribacter aquimarinus]|uniref:Peptidylprolyl isomerase n=1 Tax=Polaribacter aquimarinus TaxID=2100726 RepID=A0A2U2J9I4_9FLAO|nr:hypothetical protein [Polaribacter aquimarinus]PWG04999.1 hypothetical protein DIS07_11075 [Polaribacter aquimarinus]
MKKIAFFLLVLLLVSCDYFNIQEKNDKSSEIVAIVNTDKLFREDLKNILPNNISKADSLVIVRSYIQDWAIKKLLLKKANNNSSLNDINEIDKLVLDYKESLLINKYKEQLIKERLDTLIFDEEVEEYYQLNNNNFRLNEELVKIRYLHFDANVIDKKEFVELFKSDDIEDLETLEKQQLSFKFHQFNDSIWIPLDNILLKLPFSKEKLLKKTKFIQKQDSIGLYLVAIKDVLKRNSIAPLSYIKPTIKQMILHKRKIELIREIEKILVKDATQNNSFKIY